MSHTKIINGIIHPSVTELTGLMPKLWIPHWHAAEERKGLLRVLEVGDETEIEAFLAKERCSDNACHCEAAKKKMAGGKAGTGFHKAIEAHLYGQPIPPLLSGEALAFRRFLGWAKKHTIKPIFLEKSVRHSVWKYVGTFDGLCEIDGIVTLPDWKSSNSMDAGFRLQIPAYAAAAIDEGLIKEWPRGLVLRCDKREKPWERAVDEEWLTPQEMQDNFIVFTSLRRPYDFALRNGLLRMG